MTFLYPRLVTLSRPVADPGVGARPYGGLSPANETTLAAGVPAHVQADRQGTAPETRLPGDAAGDSIWKVIVKVALGLVRTDDIVTDDLGNRYQVISAAWGPLVTTLRCQILQT